MIIIKDFALFLYLTYSEVNVEVYIFYLAATDV